MSSIFYDKAYLFSGDFKSERNLVEIFSNFDTIPIFVIRFALLIYQVECENVILELIKTNNNFEDLLDCIITSGGVKLCDISSLKSLCPDECICTKEIKYNRLYNKMLKMIKKDTMILTKPSFYKNFITLLTKTGCYTRGLYNAIDKVTVKNRDHDMNVIGLIIDGSLFSHNYRSIVRRIKAYTIDSGLKISCDRLVHVIEKHNERCSHIRDNIYISDIKYANNMSSIVDNKFTHVVSLTRKELVMANTDLKYYHIDIPDKATIDFIDEVSSTILQLVSIDKKKSKILCHCFSGISRSVLFVAVLLTYKHGISFSAALQIVKDNRNISDPNPELLDQISDKLAINDLNVISGEKIVLPDSYNDSDTDSVSPTSDSSP